jgi:hypothetical protein
VGSVDKPKPFLDRLPEALLNGYSTNDRINRYLIDNLPTEAWKAKPPDGKGRPIAAIVAHMHNVARDVAESGEGGGHSGTTRSL